MAATSPQPSRLLSIPPELRNRIYRNVLLDPGRINVSATGFTEPELLLTCKQIRSEAMGIFYNECTFVLDNDDYDPTTAIAWTMKLRALSKRKIITNRCGPPTIFSQTRPTPSWTNLLKWVKACHERQAGAMYAGETRKDAGAHIISACLLMGVNLRDTPWAGLEKVLEHQHCALVALDERWR